MPGPQLAQPLGVGADGRVHGRDERQDGAGDRAPGEVGAHRLVGGGEPRRVEGVRHVERHRDDPGPRAGLPHGVETVRRTADHDLTRLVEAGEPHVVDAVHQPAAGLLVGLYGEHPAAQATLGLPEGRAPVHQQPHRVLVGEGAGRRGRGELPDAVAEDQVGGDAEAGEEPGGGDLDGPEQRLAHLGGGEPAPDLPGVVAGAVAVGGRRLAVQQVDDVEAGVLADRGAEAVDRRPETGEPLVEVPHHARPLTALTWVDEGEPALLGRQRGVGGVGPVAEVAPLALDELPAGVAQPLDERLRVVGDDREPGRQRPAGAEGVGHGCQRGGVRRVECVENVADVLVQRLGTTGREQDELGAGVRGVPAGNGNGSGSGPLLQDHVDVRPAEAERADGGPVRSTGVRKGPRRVGEPQARGVDAQTRVRGGLRLRNDRPVVDHQRGLDQSGDARGGQRVPDEGLAGADVAQRGVVVGVLGTQPAQRLDLGAVPGRGTGAVGLQEVHRGRGDPGVVVGPAHGAQLAFGSGRQRPGGRAVVGRADALDHRVHPVARRERVGERPYDDGAGALAEDETVGRLVEGAAHPGGGERPERGEADQAVRGEVDVHAPDDGDAAAALAQLGHGLVQGDERAGAGGVDGEAGPAEVEVPADGARGHVEQAARQAEGLDGAERSRVVLDGVEQVTGVPGGPLGVLGQGDGADGGRHEVLVVGHRQAAEHPGVLPVEVAPAQPRVVESLAGDVQQQPVLRVHGPGAGGRYAVVQGVEAVHVVQEGDLVGVRGMGGRRIVGLVEGLMVPALLRHGGELSFPAQQELPVGADVGSAGEAAAESGDGDVGHGSSSLP